MRVVLDTNILVAAGFNPRSSAARIIQAARQGELAFVWHASTRAESRKLLDQIPPLDWAQFTDLFEPAAEHTGPLDLGAFAQVPDPDDRKYAALAAAADAILVSNDAHLLARRDTLPITVRTSSELARDLPTAR